MGFPAETLLDLEVASLIDETPLIRSFVLGPMAGSERLPGFEAGAHIRVWPPGIDDFRCYSLIATVPDPAAWSAPDTWRIAVRLDEGGKGGSRAMHGLKPGDRLKASLPRNDFALSEGGAPVLLVAGGVGVTPLLSMAARAPGAGTSVPRRLQRPERDAIRLRRCASVADGTEPADAPLRRASGSSPRHRRPAGGRRT